MPAIPSPTNQPTHQYIPVPYCHQKLAELQILCLGGEWEGNTHCFNTPSQHHISVGLARKIKKQLLILQYIKFLISHKPCQFLEICCTATQFVNLYSLELEILLLISCPPSSARCFPGPTSLLRPQENLKSCPHAEPWELLQPHCGCTE